MIKKKKWKNNGTQEIGLSTLPLVFGVGEHRPQSEFFKNILKMLRNW